jgi:predicted PurR-regulated permease PerM
MAGPAERRLGPTLVALFCIALLLVLAARVATVLLLLFIAALLAVYLSATTDSIVRRLRRLPRGGALALAVLGSLLALTGVGALILPPVIQQTQDLIAALPTQAQRLEALLTRLSVQYPILEQPLSLEGGGVVENMVRDATSFVRASLLPYLRAGGTLAIELMSVLAMAVYLAREPGVYREGVILLVPPPYRHIARGTLADLSNTMRAWVWAQLLAMTVLALLTVAGLVALRVPYALAFGVFTGVVAIVPFFGSMVSTLLPALFVLANTGWVHGLAVALLGVAVHLLEANVVAPLIFQQRIRLPPVLTILSVLVMASLLGAAGLVIAVPLLAAVMVVARHVLIGEVYHEESTGRIAAAVLVEPTGERRAVVVPES